MTDIIGSSGDKGNSLVLGFCGAKESSGLCAAKVQLLFKISVRGIIESQDYGVFRCMEVACLIDAVD